MTEEQKIRLKYSELLGEFVGVLEGITWWDIPRELENKLRSLIDEKQTELEIFLKE